MPRFIPLLSAAVLSAIFATSAQAGVQVLTSIKPLQLIAAAVQDGTGSTPDVLLPPGASPHSYALRPSDLGRVQNSALFYWVGPGLETFLPPVLKNRAAPTVALQEEPGLHLRHFGEEEAEETGHDEHKTAGKHEHEHDHDHRAGALDAHLWLAPENARVIARRMSKDLSAADPSNAERYTANLVAFEKRLSETEAQLRARIAPLTKKPFFVFHEAFDYYEEAFGLAHTGVFAISADVKPGAQHVAQMRQQLQASGAACVFSEPPLRPRLAETLSEGLPVRLAELDALGYGLKPEIGAYEQLLTQLGDGLAGCLEKL